MKNTPAVNGQANTNGQNKNDKDAKFTIVPGEAIPVSKLIEQAKAANGDNIKEPTNYPAPAEKEPADQPQTPAQPAAQVTPVLETMTPPATPVRSRSEEIEFQISKTAKLQLINTQLQGMRAKLAELQKFSFTVDKDDDSRYGRITIYDDTNREFSCKNHGLTALLVSELKQILERKIVEKENELLEVSKS